MSSTVYWKYEKYVYQKTFTPENTEELIAEITSKTARMQIDGVRLTLNVDDYNIDPERPVHATKMPNNIIHPCHGHNYYEINYLISGSGIQIIGDTVHEMRHGDFLLLPPSVEHSAYTFGGCVGINVLCRREYIEQLERRLRGIDDGNVITRAVRGKRACFLTVPEDVRETADELFMRILSEVTNVNAPRGRYSSLYIEGMFLELVALICTGVGSETDLAVDPHDTRGKEQILDYIKSNYTTVSLESVAKHFNFSTVMIYSVIKELTGNNFATYIKSLRLQRAQYLLETTSLPVASVCEMVGLKNTEYFCRFFKRQTGYTPTEYRKLTKSNLYISPNRKTVAYPIRTEDGKAR